eukprot:CAMPEP_0168627688 /NCGR_PEP_ID=MMETSP0449_2-20121227/11408_1 /TAXON_ID=1082188 /ORGANISM="Strombidium rassoulzadegani, Strain ras09" /LENGTH=306 /DNA_ID=CAMNT_0008669985 /DNA_START=797 /DNA_END=1714 /DNA_ORIENTATION=-
MSTPGPIGCTVDDLIVGMQVLLRPEPQTIDPFHPPVPFDSQMMEEVQSEASRKQIKIGIIQESPFLPVSAAVKRAVHTAETALKELGYRVEPFLFEEDVWRMQRDIFYQIYSNKVVSPVVDSLKANSEDLSEGLSVFDEQLNPQSTFLAWLASLFRRSGDREKKVKERMGRLSSQEMARVLKLRADFAYQLAQKWKKSGLSALISPMWPHCAYRSANSKELFLGNEYATLWSVIGFPAGVVPVTSVLLEEESFFDHFGDRWTEKLNEDAKGSMDMPVGVQVIGHAFEDEKVLGIMKQLSAQVGYKV